MQPRDHSFVRHETRGAAHAAGIGARRPRTPCADRLGERTKRQHLGRVNVALRTDSTASWAVLPVSQSPDPPPPRAGLALTTTLDPTRLPRIRLWGSIMRSTGMLNPSPRGLLQPCGTRCETLRFRLLPALAPFLRRRRSKVPVRDTDLVHRWALPPRGALRPFLGHSAKMPRIRFYNRRFASRAPMSRHYLWRLPAERRGKPADVRPRDRFRIDGVLRLWNSIATPDHLAVIRPPTAARLTARRRLWADWLPLLALTREVGVKRRSLVGWRRLRRIAPSDASRGRRGMARGERAKSPIA